MTLAEDAALVARLVAVGEAYALEYFWLMVHQQAAIGEMLHLMGRVVLVRPAGWNPAAVRMRYNAGVRPHFDAGCFWCQTRGRRRYCHHLIEIQHGGSNSWRNLVPLCFVCHQRLHPWLEHEPAPQLMAGFEPVQSIAVRVLEEVLP